MKKKQILISLVIGLAFCVNNLNAQLLTVNEKLVGRWELCTKDGKKSELPNVRQKIYTKDSYVVLEVNKSDNTTYVDFIGKTTANGEKEMIETVIYTDSRIKNMLSKSFKFSYKIEGEYLYLVGLEGNPFNEIWIRVSE